MCFTACWYSEINQPLPVSFLHAHTCVEICACTRCRHLNLTRWQDIMLYTSNQKKYSIVFLDRVNTKHFDKFRFFVWISRDTSSLSCAMLLGRSLVQGRSILTFHLRNDSVFYETAHITGIWVFIPRGGGIANYREVPWLALNLCTEASGGYDFDNETQAFVLR